MPEAALEALANQNIPFSVKGPTAYEQQISVLLKPAVVSFHQGWQEAQEGNTLPIATLWDDTDTV